MNIREIEALTIKEMEEMKNEGTAELITIKDHSCYLVDLKDYFGYSVLVFKNDRHIYYANDYQLHHGTKTIPDLKQWYVDTLNNKLFTEEELFEDVKNYYEYEQKGQYIRNYWIMQFDYISAFCIGTITKELEEAKRKMFYCPVCFCYVKDREIVEQAINFLNHIETSFAKIQNNEEVFRKMISYELGNHEAGYTCDYTDALDALGLQFEELTEEQKKIVKEELNKQINYQETAI